MKREKSIRSPNLFLLVPPLLKEGRELLNLPDPPDGFPPKERTGLLPPKRETGREEAETFRAKLRLFIIFSLCHGHQSQDTQSLDDFHKRQSR